MLKQESIHIMKKNLQKIFLDRIEKLPNNAGKSKDYHLKKMSKQLHTEFDNIWVRYNDNKATYDQWIKSLDKWLSVECI